MKVGVLALQGDFREHALVLRDLGVEPIEVRTPEHLGEVEALILPGGESTTMAKLARSHELVEPIRDRVARGMPMMGTCAGMILMADQVEGGPPLLSVMDLVVRRNAYGRQVDSFEADVDVNGIEGAVRAVFIRAPWVERFGPGVRVLAEHAGRPVVLEQANLLAAAFHPELAGEARLHSFFLEKV